MADVKWLEQAAVDYVLWMKKSGYSAFTIAAHERLTGHFIIFVEKSGLNREEIFSHDTLKAFEKDCPLYLAACSVRGLSRYLAIRNVIAKPITKPREPLPEIYEDYLEFMEINKQVVSSGNGDVYAFMLYKRNKYFSALNFFRGRPKITKQLLSHTLLTPLKTERGPFSNWNRKIGSRGSLLLKRWSSSAGFSACPALS